MIRVENITKYHLGRPVLRDISLSVPASSHLGLIGPGGAGKSVLLKIIAGLIEPDDGKVFIDGIDVHALEETELAGLRNRIGMLFQNYALFDFMTVAENIGFPLVQIGTDPSTVTRRVDELLEAIGLPTAADKFPNELSGGMKKRVSFARAVIQRPPILLYDDPTAGLDPVTSSKIFALLERMQSKYDTTAITVSHDIGGIEPLCDQFAMLDGGRLVFSGTPDQIDRTDKEVVRRFWDGSSADAWGTP